MTGIYETYAPVYDAIGQGRFSAAMAQHTVRWLTERDAQPACVLDLACGTGSAALVFAEAGCQIAGVDRSAAMLEIARGRVRDAGLNVAFVQGDIRRIEMADQRPTTNDQIDHDTSLSSLVFGPSSSVLGPPSSALGPRSFDLVTCFYDSLNCLVEDGDLDRVFGGAALALRTGGWLIFDINTETEYTTWDERDVVTHDSADIMVYNRLDYDPQSRLATGRIVWFVREIERWWRGEETHSRRAWRDAEVRAALVGAGLVLEARLDAEWKPAAEHATRVVYLARRWKNEPQRHRDTESLV